MRTVRIGITTSIVQQGKTGISRYLLSLLKEFLNFNLDCEFYLYVLQDDLHLFEFAIDRCRIHVVPRIYSNPVRNIIWHQTVLPVLARRHRLDVLHVPSYRRMLWARPCTMVATIHDLAQFNVPGKYDRARMIYGRTVVPHLARRQDRIIAISEYTAHDVRNLFGVKYDRLKVVYNGLDHGRYHPGSRPDSIRTVFTKHGIQGNFLLYVSRLEHPAKNHVRLVEAFDAFKTETGSKWKLVFAGGDWHGAETIHEKVRSSKFVNDIQVLGFVKDDDLPDLYRAAEVFIYPSLFEGFGLPTLEASACGCPVVCSPCGALSEVMGQAALYLNPYDVKSIQRKMSRICLDQEYREQLRVLGLNRAKNFSWSACAANTLSVYEEAFSQSMSVLNRQFARI